MLGNLQARLSIIRLECMSNSTLSEGWERATQRIKMARTTQSNRLTTQWATQASNMVQALENELYEINCQAYCEEQAWADLEEGKRYIIRTDLHIPF